MTEPLRFPPAVERWLAEAAANPEAFWGRAAEALPWFRRWDRVFEPDPPSFRWFVGGRTNLAHNALDRHVAAGNGERLALVAVNERGERRDLTYRGLLDEVEQVAAALRGLGIRRRDRVTLYLPTCPEAIVAMLAIVRIGAIHSIVFAGFGHTALGDRIRASGSRLVLTADVTYRKGRATELKPIVDAALADDPGAVEHVVVLEREPGRAPLDRPRDLSWSQLLERAEGHDGGHVEMESNEPAFILATSGTTATPKLAVHTHGGYQVHIVAMARWLVSRVGADRETAHLWALSTPNRRAYNSSVSNDQRIISASSTRDNGVRSARAGHAQSHLRGPGGGTSAAANRESEPHAAAREDSSP